MVRNSANAAKRASDSTSANSAPPRQTDTRARAPSPVAEATRAGSACSLSAVRRSALTDSPKTPLASLVIEDGSEEKLAIEIGPKNVRHPDLRVGRLPNEEI